MVEVGMRIREARKGAGLSVTVLAERTGFARRTISAWEEGTRRPRQENLETLAEHLDHDVAWFYTASEEAAA